ncbi:MAG TPA: DHA2 family efflux MFS transporter permease subunit [Sporichthya sp.]|nr:DHA2 family efflux MFS transporter permease subunit [Sporichthya sp.]
MVVVTDGPVDVGPVPVQSAEDEAARRAARRRWLGLLVITGSQLLIVLDGTVVNIALPLMAQDLGMSDADRQWVVTAYTLAFGGLLLLGGRIGDVFGLRRTFVVGLVGFGLSSALAGSAPNFELVLSARALQGLFGALMAPAALALLANTFSDPRERIKAFSLFGTVAGAGSGVGLIVGGVLTESVSWRATMLINVPVAIVLVWATLRFLDEFKSEHKVRLDFVGAVLATAGLTTLVYGFSNAERHGWTSTGTLWCFGLGGSLLIVFLVSQRMLPNPLLPLRVVANRNRAGANLAVMLLVVGLFGVFFFMSFYFQEVLGYSPLKTGVAFLPVTVCIVGASEIMTRYSAKYPPRLLMTGGLLGTAVSLALFTRLDVNSNYWTDLLPGMIIMGLSVVCVFVPAFNVGTLGVQPQDAGVASALINTAQQVGGSLGIALLSTIAADRHDSWLQGKADTTENLLEASVAGYARASLWATAIMLLAAALTLALVNAKKIDGGHGGHAGDEAADAQPDVFDPTTQDHGQADVAHSDATGRTGDVFAVAEAELALGVHPVTGGSAPVVSGGGGLTIRVSDAIGRPLMGVAVSLLDPTGRQIAVTDTGVVGRCELPDLPTGEALLVAVHPAYAPYAQSVVVPGSGSAQADVLLGAEPTRASLISGEALTPQGWLIADARVSLIDAAGFECAVTRTDSQGRYAFTGVPAGDYTLLATGYGPSTASVRVGSEAGPAAVVVAPITLAHPEDLVVSEHLSVS